MSKHFFFFHKGTEGTQEGQNVVSVWKFFIFFWTGSIEEQSAGGLSLTKTVGMEILMRRTSSDFFFTLKGLI